MNGRLHSPAAWTLLLLGTLLLLPAAGQHSGADDPIAALAWLEGHWEGLFGNSPYEERYSSPRGGQILWMSKTYAGERAVFFEFGTFEIVDGKAAYIPYPKGSRRDPFFLKELGPGQRAIFENPANDFPTVFIFESPSALELRIILQGPDGSAGHQQTIELKRVG